MSVDLSRFHATFFEESLEATTVMEAELLALERVFRRGGTAAIDAESLNRIFRAAHSIKGGSGTFGFHQISDFAHVLESLLEDVRSGRRALDLPAIDLLLRAVDSLRTLLNVTTAGESEAPAGIDALRNELEQAQVPRAKTASTVAPPSGGPSHPWQIRFMPHAGFFQTGNDPLRIVRAVAELGNVSAQIDISRLPTWEELDPESCYLGWNLTLQTPRPRSALDDIFSWVIDDCDLELTPIVITSAISPNTPKADDAATSMRVATAKVDALVDMVGELLITQTMLSQSIESFTPDALPRIRNAVAQLERHTRALQDGVLGIRMLPIEFVFNRLPRLARELSSALGKQVELEFAGERTELDKTIIERISDPLIHLVRNCIDHGIESPEERVRKGKEAIGTVRLHAYHKAGNFVLEVEDDGRGLDRERILQKARERGLVGAEANLDPAQIDEFIFVPGFSTAHEVSDISGRGVGMDVVRNNIRSLGGGVEVKSVAGGGTRFTLRLPLTLAILDGLGVDVAGQNYILPLVAITESVRLGNEDLHTLPGGGEVFGLRKEYLPLVRLYDIFGLPPRVTEITSGTVVIIEADGNRAGLFVDQILGQQQVVIKSLETHYRRVEGVAAATILGDGTVALILDAGGLIRLAHGRTGTSSLTATEALLPTQPGAALH